MKAKIVASMLIALAVLFCTSCGSDPNPSMIQTSFNTPTGTGMLRKSDTLWIINLEGSYTDMGRQYGALLKSELGTLFRQMDTALGYDRGIVQQLLGAVKMQMKSRESQLLGGMELESGLSRDKLEFLNGSLFFMYANVGCSAFAAINDQTAAGFTIAGRNFDNPRGAYSSILRGKSIVVIYNPKDQFNGSGGTHRDNSVAMMTQIGWLYGLTNLNSKGVYLEYNNATNSIPIDPATIGPIVATVMDGLHQNLYASLDADSLEDVDALLAGPAAVATMTQVADKHRVWHYERSPYENSKKIAAGQAFGRFSYDNPPNTDIFTNHFFNDNWAHQKFIYTVTNDSGSKTFARLINLQKLARQYSGRITADTMKTIMTKPLQNDGNGGPFIGWDLANPDVTHFTSVTDIANMVMHIYPNVDAMTYVDNFTASWATIDLNREFR